MAVKSLTRSTIESSAQPNNSMLAGYSTSDFELIQTVYIAGNTASVTFDVSQYATKYRHLQIRVAAKTSNGNPTESLVFRCNSDSGSNYTEHVLYGDGSSISSANSTTNSFASLGTLAAAGNASAIFGAIIADILDFASTSKYKVMRSLSGVANNYIQLRSGMWVSTAAITTLTLYPATGSFMVAGSRISLYGIKG